MIKEYIDALRAAPDPSYRTNLINGFESWDQSRVIEYKNILNTLMGDKTEHDLRADLALDRILVEMGLTHRFARIARKRLAKKREHCKRRNGLNMVCRVKPRTIKRRF